MQGPAPFPQGIFVPYTLLKPRAFATLPAASVGLVAYINDSNTAVGGAVAAGGGSNKVMVAGDGTNWIVTGGATPPGVGATASQSTLTTVGAGSLLAAAILTTDTLRSGPTSVFTDTTVAASVIQAAWSGGVTGSSFRWTYQNSTAFNATIVAGSGITLSPATVVVPANTTANFLVVWTGTNTITMYLISLSESTPLPNAKYVTSSVTVGTMTAGLITGARKTNWTQTGATPGAQTTRTAAQMLADTPNGKVGSTWIARIANTGVGVLTVTADASVTLTGTATVAQNTWSEYLLTILTATTASMQYVGSGTMV